MVLTILGFAATVGAAVPAAVSAVGGTIVGVSATGATVRLSGAASMCTASTVGTVGGSRCAMRNVLTTRGVVSVACVAGVDAKGGRAAGCGASAVTVLEPVLPEMPLELLAASSAGGWNRLACCRKLLFSTVATLSTLWEASSANGWGFRPSV